MSNNDTGHTHGCPQMADLGEKSSIFLNLGGAITILLICLSGGVPELPQNGLKYILNSPNSPSPQVPSREKGERPKRGEK